MGLCDGVTSGVYVVCVCAFTHWTITQVSHSAGVSQQFPKHVRGGFLPDLQHLYSLVTATQKKTTVRGRNIIIIIVVNSINDNRIYRTFKNVNTRIAAAILHPLPQQAWLQEQSHSTFNLQSKHPATLTPSSYPAVHVANLSTMCSLCVTC